jgi:hypothetical protein
MEEESRIRGVVDGRKRCPGHRNLKCNEKMAAGQTEPSFRRRKTVIPAP